MNLVGYTWKYVHEDSSLSQWNITPEQSPSVRAKNKTFQGRTAMRFGFGLCSSGALRGGG
jgi:hypothetical protein